jgi:outer membrane lipoprotein SlyB
MPNESSALPKDVHDEILREEILSSRNFTAATPQEHPRVIILAGQPGAGKGTLTNGARTEFGNDVVVVDPDELRGSHPKVKSFRHDHPYTWADDTHPDASAWAKELRSAAVDGRKNMIIDSTLADGDKAVALVNELQAKGYTVEIRAMASHRLESELGVDQRFSKSLDFDGYGRYVPEGIRDQVYRDLPGNLNQVAAETGTPIRIFDREGAELYDSRADTRLPGAALEEAREARLKDPKITHQMRDGWREQQAWHRELPETLPQNPKIDPQTQGNLLAQRAKEGVVEAVERDAGLAKQIDHEVRVRPARVQAGGALGIAGIALTMYDAAETGQTMSRQLGQGNATAAESTLLHFGARNVGGWTGAGLGAVGGAALGVESGPGLLVTGAIGGIAGTVAGDKVAAWMDERKIYNQDDRQGHTWTFDPKKPQEGWQREAPIDDRNDGIDRPIRDNLRASPALANELNYKATTVSAELILGAPPKPTDPFSQPANSRDTPSVTPANWMRDADSGEWKREVVLAYAERGLSPKRTEVADSDRAAELDRDAARTLLRNADNSPAGIATRYEDAYIRNGWAAYGEMPEAVRLARIDVSTLKASDDNLYERRQDGEWVSKGVFRDTIATGNLREELNATREVLQATLPPPQPVQAPPPMNEDARLRDTLLGAYGNAQVTPSEERLQASVAAVRETFTAQGLDPNTTALQLQRQPDGRYGPDSPIASMRLDSDGSYRIAAVTSLEDIQRAETALKATPHAIEVPSAQQHETHTQALHEANRLGLSQDEAQQIALRETQRTTPTTPAMASLGDRNAKSNSDSDAPPQETPKRNGNGAELYEPSQTVLPPPSLSDPRDRNDPDHRLYAQIEKGIHKLDAELGRTPDAGSERLAMAAYLSAKREGIESADHVALSKKGTEYAQGSFVFVVQGQDPSDERNKVARVSTHEALNQPVEHSLQKLNDLNQQQAMTIAQQQDQPSPDAPSRGPRIA